MIITAEVWGVTAGTRLIREKNKASVVQCTAEALLLGGVVVLSLGFAALARKLCELCHLLPRDTERGRWDLVTGEVEPELIARLRPGVAAACPELQESWSFSTCMANDRRLDLRCCSDLLVTADRLFRKAQEVDLLCDLEFVADLEDQYGARRSRFGRRVVRLHEEVALSQSPGQHSCQSEPCVSLAAL